LNARSCSTAFLLVLAFGLFARAEDSAPSPSIEPCLPNGIRRTEIAEVITEAVSNAASGAPRRITVQDKLSALQAHCRAGKLVDGSGREIVFYRLAGCWGHPPPNYQELLAKQRSELAALRERFTVVEMTCNPSGAHIP
jgi:hypothetical protein